MEVTEHKNYIDNIDELHQGIDERNENEDEERDVDIVDQFMENDSEDDLCETDEASTGIDSLTAEALEVIEKTEWLGESIQSNQTIQPEFECTSELPLIETWRDDMERQNQDKLSNDEPDECDICEEPMSSSAQPMTTDSDNNVEVFMETDCNIAQQDSESVQQIIDETISRYNLNKKQKVAFMTAIKNVVKRHNNEPTQQVIGYVGGPGGTGKSQVIKAIVDFHKKMKVKNTLKLSANTGTAAKHIGGSTTTTLFGFSSDKKSNAKLQKTFEKVETIIIDEVSMIGCRQIVKIANALSKGKCADPSIPFGGIDIIFFGDFIQFSPVLDTPLYYGWMTDESRARNKQSKVDVQLGMHLWKQVNHIVLLDEQMRVQDQEYLALLNRLREGECTDADVAMLNRRVVGQSVNITSITEAPIITPGNQLVMAVNNQFVDGHSQHTDVYVSTAYDCLGKKRKVPKKVAKRYKDKAPTATSGLPRELKLFVGMPVMVSCNIKTELGITNGTTGKVKFIKLKNGEMINEDTGCYYLEQQPEYIIVKLDDIDVKPLDGLPLNHIPIFPMKKNFKVSMPGKQKAVTVYREHFPIVPLFSCTAHKSQGQTLSKAIIDLVPTSKPKGIEFSYVPLSRVRRLDDLTILRPFDPSVLRLKVNEGCVAMMKEFKARDLCKDL